ncbi:MAG: aldo/keto reductase [Oscillospiraceae bacterium]|nr:aldo/keto reductase [Oscillospiraceae bacterium]
MKYVPLGDSGIVVSQLCFGSLTVGPLQANLPVEEGAEVISYAFSRGINFIDTAQYYENYRYIKLTDDIIISSKTYAYNRAQAIDAVEEARRELNRDSKRDYVDIFMLHEQESIHTLRGHMEALEYLFEAKEKGIIRAVGVSMHHVAAVEGVCELKKRGYPINCIHPIYNMLGIGIADGTVSEMVCAMTKAKDLGIGIFSMKPLAGGHLYNRAAEAFDFVLACNAIASVAVGMQSIAEVDANINYFESLEKMAFDNLNKVKRRLFIENYCSGCGNCVKRCGQRALRIKDSQAQVDIDRCVLCGYCAKVCELFAIKVL